MNEFEFLNVKYRSKHLDGEVQIAILRRLLPAALAFGGNANNLVALYDAVLKWRASGVMPAAGADGEPPDITANHSIFDLVEKAAVTLGPMADKLGELTDDDISYIINHCAAVTYRVGANGQGDPVRTSTGVIKNKDDASLPVRLAIAWHVVRVDLGGTLMGFLGDMIPAVPDGGEA